MKKTVIECEFCHNEAQIDPPTFGSANIKWITVIKPMSLSGDWLGAGTYTFCDEACLRAFCRQRKVEPAVTCDD